MSGSNFQQKLKDIQDKSFKTKFSRQEYDRFWLELFTDTNAELMIEKLLSSIIKAETDILSNKSINQEYALTTLYTILLFQMGRSRYQFSKIYKETFESKNPFFQNIITTLRELVDLPQQNQQQQQLFHTQYQYNQDSPKNQQYFNNQQKINQVDIIKIDSLLSMICNIPLNITQPLLKSFSQKHQLDDLDVKNAIIILNNQKESTNILKEYYQKIYNYQNDVIKQEIKNEGGDRDIHMLILDEYDIIETSESSYAYEYLKEIMNKYSFTQYQLQYEEIYEQVIFNFLFYLNMIPYLSLISGGHAEKTALNLLHIIKQVIIFHPVIKYKNEDSNSTLTLLINKIEIFRSWPFPVGFVAQELLNILYSEKKTLGNAYRFKLREDIPDVDFLNQEFKKIKDKSLLFSSFCIINDKDSYYANRIQNQYESSINGNDIPDAHYYRLAILIHIFNLHNKDDQAFIQDLFYLNEKDIFLNYCRVLNIIEKCDELDSIAHIKTIQERAFDELKKTIQQNKNKQNKYLNENSNLLHNLPYSLPSYSTCSIKRIDHLKKDDDMFQALEKIGEKDIIKNYGYGSQIMQSIQEIKAMNLPLHQEPLRIIIFGGDVEVQAFLQEMGQLYYEYSSLFQNLDWRIYIVPIKKNTIAQFLASKDIWYQKHLYIPFKEEVLLPRLERDEKENISNQNICFPLYLQNKLIQSYLVEATRVFNIKCYEILCFKEPIQYNQQDTEKEYQAVHRIYFCQYLEIGAPVIAEQIKHNLIHQNHSKYKDLKETTNVYELKDKNMLKLDKSDKNNFQYYDLDLLTYQYNMAGIIENEEKVPTQQIHQLKLNNVYKEYFEGTPPIPNSDWLELSYIDLENSKQMYKAIKDKKNFQKKYSKQMIQNAFFSFYVQMKIHKMIIESKQPFDLLVDGRLYKGQYKQIIVRPFLQKENPDIQFTLPLMSFLPINL